MRIYRHWREVSAEGRGAVVAIGNFDGVHLGHQAVISDARRVAQEAGAPLAVLTFEPHPREVLGQMDGPFRLTPFRIKLREIAGLGVDILYLLRFDENMASLAADDFIDRLLVGGLGVSHVVVGYDFAFGRRRGGNFALLQERSEFGGYQVSQVSVAGTDEGKYSASEARARLSAGDVAGVAQILGRPWEIEGRVQHGEHRGRKLGFATANLAVTGTLHPAHGVYALWAGFGRGAGDGLEWHPAVANLGRRPTFDENELLLEVHVLDARPSWPMECRRDVAGSGKFVAVPPPVLRWCFFVGSASLPIRFQSMHSSVYMSQMTQPEGRQPLMNSLHSSLLPSGRP